MKKICFILFFAASSLVLGSCKEDFLGVEHVRCFDCNYFPPPFEMRNYSNMEYIYISIDYNFYSRSQFSEFFWVKEFFCLKERDKREGYTLSSSDKLISKNLLKGKIVTKVYDNENKDNLIYKSESLDVSNLFATRIEHSSNLDLNVNESITTDVEFVATIKIPFKGKSIYVEITEEQNATKDYLWKKVYTGKQELYSNHDFSDENCPFWNEIRARD